MKTRQFKKRNYRRNFFKKITIAMLTVILLALPIQTSLNGLNLLGLGVNVADAQSLNEINILSDTNTEAGTTGTMGNNTFYVNISGNVASNINLMKNDQVFNIHLDLSELPDRVREKVEIVPAQDGEVTVTFTPINFTLISTDLTDSFNFTSDIIEMGSVKLLELINDLVSLPLVGHLITVKGVDEYVSAYQEFTQLRYQTQNIPDYHGTAPVSVNNDTDTVSFEFTHEIQRHVTTSIKDRVLSVTNNLQHAIDNIKIELFPRSSFLNRLSFLMEGIHFILDKMTDSINSRLLEPLESGKLDGSGVSNNLGIKGQLNASTTLQINNAIGICDGIESVGQGTYPVTVRGLATNQVVASSDLYHDLNAADEVTIIVLPHQNCLTGTTVGPSMDYGDRFNIGGIQGVDRYIDPSDLLDLEEEIEENKKAQEEADIEAAKDLAREMKEKRRGATKEDGLQVDRDKKPRNTTQRQADSDKDEADEEKDETEGRAEGDAKDNDDEKADGDSDSVKENDGKARKSFGDRVRDFFKPRKDIGGETEQSDKDQQENEGSSDQESEDKGNRDLEKPKKDANIDTENKNRPQVDRDGSKSKSDRNTQQRTENGNKAEDNEKADGDTEDKAGDNEKADGDADSKAENDAGGKDGDAQDGTQDAAGSNSGSSTNIDIDVDDIEEGIGLLQRLLEIIMKILDALTNK